VSARPRSTWFAERPSLSGTYNDILDLSDGNRPTSKLFDLVPDGSRVLDIGCATGYLARALTERKRCQVTGIETDPAAARLAAPWCAQMLAGDVEDATVLDLADGGFDVIIMGDVLEHLRRPGDMLVRLRSRLAPGGLLLLSAPSVAHFSVRKELLPGRFERNRAPDSRSLAPAFLHARIAAEAARGDGLRHRAVRHQLQHAGQTRRVAAPARAAMLEGASTS